MVGFQGGNTKKDDPEMINRNRIVRSYWRLFIVHRVVGKHRYIRYISLNTVILQLQSGCRSLCSYVRHIFFLFTTVWTASITWNSMGFFGVFFFQFCFWPLPNVLLNQSEVGFCFVFLLFFSKPERSFRIYAIVECGETLIEFWISVSVKSFTSWSYPPGLEK